MQLNMCFNFLVLLTCVDQTDNLATSKQNAFQHVLTKRLICQRGHKIRVHASEEQIAFQQSLTKHIRCQRSHQMLLIICLLIPHLPPFSQYSYFDETHPMPAKIKCTSTRYEKTHHMPARTKMHLNMNVQNNPMSATARNATQQVFTKPYHASEDTIYISICWPSMALNASQHVFNHTHSIPAMTQNAYQPLRKSVTTFVDDTPSMRKMTQMYLSPRCPCALYFSEDIKSIWTCVQKRRH